MGGIGEERGSGLTKCEQLCIRMGVMGFITVGMPQFRKHKLEYLEYMECAENDMACVSYRVKNQSIGRICTTQWLPDSDGFWIITVAFCLQRGGRWPVEFGVEFRWSKIVQDVVEGLFETCLA